MIKQQRTTEKLTDNTITSSYLNYQPKILPRTQASPPCYQKFISVLGLLILKSLNCYKLHFTKITSFYTNNLSMQRNNIMLLLLYSKTLLVLYKVIWNDIKTFHHNSVNGIFLVHARLLTGLPGAPSGPVSPRSPGSPYKYTMSKVINTIRCKTTSQHKTNAHRHCSAGNNSRSPDNVGPNFENVRPIPHYDRTR